MKKQHKNYQIFIICEHAKPVSMQIFFRDFHTKFLVQLKSNLHCSWAFQALLFYHFKKLNSWRNFRSPGECHSIWQNTLTWSNSSSAQELECDISNDSWKFKYKDQSITLFYQANHWKFKFNSTDSQKYCPYQNTKLNYIISNWWTAH